MLELRSIRVTITFMHSTAIRRFPTNGLLHLIIRKEFINRKFSFPSSVKNAGWYLPHLTLAKLYLHMRV
ncbi:hypothetical protein GE061_013219 [Apolygus lucorum]|uniref:Uncharacterized protein n=1 Tax=Apolygus lucorum TaxID=248454 RepID=A0A6A4JDD8_APOLU|nr:hypothetical protein GE061_013219 [Apolygus lucorum]